MKRRQVLAALAGLGLTGGSVWAVQKGLPSDSSTLPITVETIDAQGSEAGRIKVPVRDDPTVVDLFATWCLPCKEQMEVLSSVHPEYDDSVEFVSVTNERVGGSLTKDDIREWWRDHGGRWTVGLDPKSSLMSAFGADSLPYLVVVDSSGEVRWGHGGKFDEDTLRSRMDEALGEA